MRMKVGVKKKQTNKEKLTKWILLFHKCEPDVSGHAEGLT